MGYFLRKVNFFKKVIQQEEKCLLSCHTLFLKITTIYSFKCTKMESWWGGGGNETQDFLFQ